jgi:hypothetical protein
MYTLPGQPFSFQPHSCTLYSTCLTACSYLSHRCTLSLHGSLRLPVSQVYTTLQGSCGYLSHRCILSLLAACSYLFHRCTLSALCSLQLPVSQVFLFPGRQLPASRVFTLSCLDSTNQLPASHVYILPDRQYAATCLIGVYFPCFRHAASHLSHRLHFPR